MILDNLEPKNVFRYFEEICSIPHGSYHTDKIADYVVDFAKAHKLEYFRDSHNNVVIKKSASPNYTGNSTVIIQGHLDMVCAKDESTNIDFENQGIEIECDGEYVFAKGTTLGGDDGIAVAMALAVLDSSSITHPNLECVFTTDEEVGMLGANAMDMSMLKGKYMLNIDSEDEGQFTVSCAGGETLVVEIEKENSKRDCSHCIQIAVNGLMGGHSGVEIDKGRANAVILMGKILDAVSKKTDIQLVSIDGGQKDNAIPFECYASINTNDVAAVQRVVEDCKAEIENEYSSVEQSLNIFTRPVDFKAGFDSSVIPFLASVTNGIKAMSKEIPGLVQTSSNLGIIRTDDTKIVITFSLRSSVNTEKLALHNEIEGLAKSFNARVSAFGDYPAWEYKKNSRLQELCKRVYCEQYGTEPEIVAIHAGLECGIFCSKLKGLDCISFGPNLLDIHTAKERMEIAGVGRVYQFLLNLLMRL
ncbi:MAG: aminoacyl-histidine dipeptidase [Eubacterium sp.]